ncbi:hypothetical protein TNCV_4282021 [Trichonephila clavipes]|nr:hypothetical protein TNCV_4282021 [Trichonephila clavipes]
MPRGKSGEGCVKIDDCETGKYKDCKGDKGKCKYDDSEEKAVCICEDGRVLDEIAGYCKVKVRRIVMRQNSDPYRIRTALRDSAPFFFYYTIIKLQLICISGFLLERDGCELTRLLSQNSPRRLVETLLKPRHNPLQEENVIFLWVLTTR